MKLPLKILRRLAITLCGLLLVMLLAGRTRMEALAMGTARFLAYRAAAGRVVREVAKCPVHDVGIVPGASIRSPHLRERAETAAALFHAGKVRRLLLSGDGRTSSYDEPAALLRLLRGLGVPEEAMTADPAGLSTWDTLERAKSIHGIHHAVVITQEFHSSRTVMLGRHFDMEITVCCAASPADTRRDEIREARARVRALMDIMGLRQWTAFCETSHRISIGRVELARW